MRKYALLVVLFFVGSYAIAQQAVVFKIKYLPGLKYTSSANVNTGIEMNFKGEKEDIDKLIANGTQLPIVLQSKKTIKYTVVTGAADGKKIFPVTIKYLAAENKQIINGKEISEGINPLLGQQISGFCTADGQLKMDTSGGNKAADTLNNKIVAIVNTVEAPINFPERALKIGDSFAQDVPIAIPVAGNSTQANTHIVYKLIAIQNKTALFDIVQTVTFRSNSAEGNAEITGSGDGKLFYDIEHSTLKVYQTNLNITYIMLMGKLTMSGTAKMFAEYQTTVTSKY